MATLLEQTRAMHEELEKYERVIALDLAQDTKSHRERLAQSHRVNNTLQQISQRATKLVRAPPTLQHGCGSGTSSQTRGNTQLGVGAQPPTEHALQWKRRVQPQSAGGCRIARRMTCEFAGGGQAGGAWSYGQYRPQASPPGVLGGVGWAPRKTLL